MTTTTADELEILGLISTQYGSETLLRETVAARGASRATAAAE
jgi:hypothetical protein